MKLGTREQLQEMEYNSNSIDEEWFGELPYPANVETHVYYVPDAADSMHDVAPNVEGSHDPSYEENDLEQEDDDLELCMPCSPPQKDTSLKDEATSLRHLLTHLPKNPYCSTCQRSRNIEHRTRSGRIRGILKPKTQRYLATEALVTTLSQERLIERHSW